MANIDAADLVNSAFLVFVNYKADTSPGPTLAVRAARLLLDEALGDWITNLWTVNTSICSSKAILFERQQTTEAILVISNTQEYYNSRGEQGSQYVNSLFNDFLPTVEHLLGMGYRLCFAGHNYAGLIAKQLAQRWHADWITFQTPMPYDQRHMPRDYFDNDHLSTNHVKAAGMIPVLNDLTEGDFKNFNAMTTDPDVTIPELRQQAIARQQALERAHSQEEHLGDHNVDELLPEVDAGGAAARNNEVQAMNQQQQAMNVMDEIFGPRELNIGAPQMAEQNLPNNNVMQDNTLPSDLNFNDMQPPEISVSLPDGIKTTTYSDANYVPPPQYTQKEGSLLDYFADLGASYERDVIHQQGVGGQDISKTVVTPKYTTLPKNNNPPPTDAGLAAHEKLATTVFNNKPDPEAVVRIKQQTTVVTKKRRIFGSTKTTAETTRQGVREERATTVESNIVVNNTNQYATTSKTELVQHDHVDRNGQVTEKLQGRTMTEQTLFARQDGKAYDTYSNTTKNADGSKVIKNEVDQQRSEVKQTSYDAANKLQTTLETQNMHGSSTTTVVGPNTRHPSSNRAENIREQQVVTQRENYIDQRGSTETDHSTGQSTTTTTDRGVKRNAVGVETTITTTSTANRTNGFLTKKTIEKTKTERNYTKNNNNIAYTNDSSQLKQVIIQEAPATGAQAYFVNKKVKTTTHADGKQITKESQSFNLAAQQGIAIATAELLDKTLEMIELYKQKKLDKTIVATSVATLLTNVGEGYFAGHAANLLTTMESHLDALGLSLVTVVGASLLRFGINWFDAKSKAKDTDDKAVAKLSKKAVMLIDVGGALARSGLYYITLGAEFAFKSPVMFGASQIISAGQQVITAMLSEGITVKEALVSVAPRVGISLVSTLVSIAVQKGVVYCLGTALGGTLALSALTVIIPTFAFWASSKLLTKYVVTSPEEKELNRLLALYKLDKNANISVIKKEYRRLCLEKHPDKEGGSKEAFQTLNADFDKITALHMLREAPKQDNKDPKKVSLFQTAYYKLRQVITFIRSKGIDEEQIEPCFARLEEEIEKAAADISDAKLEFFSQLTAEFNGLQDYEQKFKEKGYDNLSHLVQIVDDETEFNALCKACGIKEGHASQLRITLRKIKNSNAPNGGGAN